MRLRETAQATASRFHAEVLSGRYRLDELLGSGGAADVYRGLDLRMRRPVAVKVFRPDACLDAEESWRSEAEILARLHHPGLVTAFDAGHHEGRAFLVMQLIEGTTLKSHIARGPLTPDATAALGAGLAQALAHAHEAGIVHRDVKPSNILLDAEHRPYLVDFGISRPLDATTRTATDTLVGTAAYLSPEQVLGRPVGRPADIYSLGLVLLECLTGRLEYGGGPVEAAIARLHRRPALPVGAPEPFRALLGRMTDQDDHARPTARECARALTAPADTTHTATAPATTERLAAVPAPPGAGAVRTRNRRAAGTTTLPAPPARAHRHGRRGRRPRRCGGGRTRRHRQLRPSRHRADRAPGVHRSRREHPCPRRRRRARGDARTTTGRTVLGPARRGRYAHGRLARTRHLLRLTRDIRRRHRLADHHGGAHAEHRAHHIEGPAHLVDHPR